MGGSWLQLFLSGKPGKAEKLCALMLVLGDVGTCGTAGLDAASVPLEKVTNEDRLNYHSKICFQSLSFQC